jgi:hypothetical protein
MPKKNTLGRKPWTKEDLRELKAHSKVRTPVVQVAKPMTYVEGGRQFVVIAAGGHNRLGSKLGDAVAAFALPAAPPGSPASPP